MRPQFMRQASIDSIHVDFAEAKRHYLLGDQDWFLKRLETEHGLGTSRFDFPDFTLSTGGGACTDEEYSATDTKNVRILYGAMRDLPPSAASDERLWAGLSHTYCWDYVRYRRTEALRSGKDRDILTSYFFTYDPRRSSRVHCLARLWWAGYLTYDEDNKADPFALTNLLTSHAFASRILLFSSTLASNRQTALGILDAIGEQRDTGIELKREHFVGANIYLNRMSGITILDAFDRKSIHDLVSEYFATDEFAELKV